MDAMKRNAQLREAIDSCIKEFARLTENKEMCCDMHGDVLACAAMDFSLMLIENLLGCMSSNVSLEKLNEELEPFAEFFCVARALIVNRTNDQVNLSSAYRVFRTKSKRYLTLTIAAVHHWAAEKKVTEVVSFAELAEKANMPPAVTKPN